MKKIFICIVLLLLLGVFVLYAVIAEQENRNQYRYETEVASIKASIIEITSDAEIGMSLPEKGTEYVMSQIKKDNVTYSLIVLPYEHEGYYGGFILRTDEYGGKWKTDRLSAFYRIKVDPKGNYNQAEYIYHNVPDGDNNTIFFAFGTAPNNSNATVFNKLIETNQNGLFGIISTKEFSITQ